jgi:RNA polymerase sigma-70 factor (ECF subfamily)
MIATNEISGSSPTVRVASARSLLAQAEAQIDAELVRRFNTGDEAAFVEIIERYRARMFAVAFAMLRNRADAEEIAQDAFLRAHRGLANFRGDSSLATWLHRIALNLSRNRYWHSVRRGRHTTDSLDVAIGEDNTATFSDLLTSSETGPVRTVMADEFAALVDACMEQLGQRQREILTMRNLLHRSYVEIAEELGINVGTVKSRIARARATLRALIVAACPEFGAEPEPCGWFEPVRPAGGIEAVCA